MALVRPELRFLLTFIGFWFVLLMATAWFFGAWDSSRTNPNQQVTSQTRNGSVEVELEANRQGHYLANGTINNHPVTLILDTGATTVSVSQEIAEEAGLEREQRGRARTAAGTVDVWSTTIRELHLGDITFQDVSATINPSMDPDMVLMGMSALGQIEFSQQQGKLTLKQTQQ